MQIPTHSEKAWGRDLLDLLPDLVPFFSFHFPVCEFSCSEVWKSFIPNLCNHSLVPGQNNRLPPSANMYHGNITVAPAFHFPELFISCSHVANLDWVVLVFQNKLGKLSQSTPSGSAQCRKKAVTLIICTTFQKVLDCRARKKWWYLIERIETSHLEEILPLKWVFFFGRLINCLGKKGN